MSFEPTKVVKMDKGKQVGDTLMQDASTIPYNNTNVGAELTKINTDLSKNNFPSEPIIITTYTDSDNPYVAPSDGYVRIYSGYVTNAGYTVFLVGANGNKNTINIGFTAINGHNSLFVRKGMKLWVEPVGSPTNGAVQFVELV